MTVRRARLGALALASGLAVAGVIAGAAPARAQTGAEQAAAEALFREARGLLEAGKVRVACAKFAESQRLDPKLGTLLNLASCHAAEGNTATAWAEFSQAAGMALTARQQARADYARSRAAELEQELSRVTFRGAPGASAPEGLRIKLGDKEFAAAAIGSRIPLDPGKYQVEVTAPGKKGWSTELDVPPGPASLEVDIPPLVDEAPAPPAPRSLAAAPAPPPAPAAPSAPPAPPDSGVGARRTLGIVLGGVGLVGIGVGTYFGLRTFSQQSVVEENCDDRYCNQEGLEAEQEARRAAPVSTIAFAAGGALLAGGVVLLLLSSGEPDAPDARVVRKGAHAARAGLWVAPQVGWGSAGLRAGGTW